MTWPATLLCFLVVAAGYFELGRAVEQRRADRRAAERPRDG